jgi:hypothetical protein
MKAVYDSDLIPEHKKFIPNKMTGLMEKAQNEVSRTKQFRSQEACDYFIQEHGDRDVPVRMHDVKEWEENEKIKHLDLWIIKEKAQQNLINGFLPIKAMIYSYQRMLMFMLGKQLREEGCHLVAIKTDCWYFEVEPSQLKTYTERAKKAEALKKVKGAWDIMGTIAYANITNDPKCIPIGTFEEKDLSEFKLRTKDIKINDIPIADEENTEEIYAAMDKHNHIAIVADGAGCGKTTLAVNYCKDRKLKCLVVLPNNKQVKEIEKQGVEACTVWKFFGAIPENKEKGISARVKKRGWDISGYKGFIFDEIFSYDTANKDRTNKFATANPELKHMCTYDQNQMPPIQDTSRENEDQYQMDNIHVRFNNHIRLKINRRLISETDKQKGPDFKTDIFDEKIPILDTMYKYYNVQTYGNDNAKALCYYNKTAERIAKKIHAKKPVPEGIVHSQDGIKYYAGMELNCKERIYYHPTKIVHVNFTYKIKKLIPTSKRVVLVDIDPSNKEEYTIKYKQLQRFILPDAGTVHSTQGATIDGPVDIHDIQVAHVTRKWVYTACTRVRRMSDVTIVLRGDTAIDISKSIHRKISGHRAADRAAGRKWEDKDYIKPKDVLEMIRKQNGCCKRCGESLELVYDSGSLGQYSINRLSNVVAHTKGNCELTCPSCNHVDA